MTAVTVLIILSITSAIMPCLFWFYRNWLRHQDRDSYKLTNSLKWIWLFCLILAIAFASLALLSASGTI